MKTSWGAPRAAMAIGALLCGTGVAARVPLPHCLLTAGARLVCDRDGCVRPTTEADCRPVGTAIAQAGRTRPRSAIRDRSAPDEIASLLASLD